MIWRRSVPFLLLVTLASGGWADVAPTNAMSRYNIITEKSPFRRFSDPAAIAPSQQAGSLTLQGFSSDGVIKKVYLRDSSQQNKMTAAVEGETVNGYRVDKIDAENRSVQLIHGVETLSLKFPEKSMTTPPPVAMGTPAVPRPVYRNMRSGQPAAVPAPMAPAPMPTLPAVVPPPATNEQPATASPTSLRRRILRQNVKAAEAPAPKEEAKEGEAPPAETPAEEAPAAQ